MNNESPESGPGQLGPSQDRPPAAAPAAKSTAAARAAARRSSRRRKISVVPALILLAVVGLVVAAFSAKPVWRMIKRQRAERFLVEGEKYAAEEKWALRQNLWVRMVNSEGPAWRKN